MTRNMEKGKRRLLMEQCTMVYVGSWEYGEMHGWGEITYADGRVYVGYWKEDKKHGKGKLTSAD